MYLIFDIFDFLHHSRHFVRIKGALLTIFRLNKELNLLFSGDWIWRCLFSLLIDDSKTPEKKNEETRVLEERKTGKLMCTQEKERARVISMFSRSASAWNHTPAQYISSDQSFMLLGQDHFVDHLWNFFGFCFYEDLPWHIQNTRLLCTRCVR